MENLTGKTILIVEGSLLSGVDLKCALKEGGAAAFVTGNELSAYSLLEKHAFDGAIIDYALHNEAFELCAELRDLNIPYVCCNAPHKLQGAQARRAAATAAVGKLARVLAKDIEIPNAAFVGSAGAKSGWGRGAQH
jgi:hypothetical protein